MVRGLNAETLAKANGLSVGGTAKSHLSARPSEKQEEVV